MRRTSIFLCCFGVAVSFVHVPTGMSMLIVGFIIYLFVRSGERL